MPADLRFLSTIADEQEKNKNRNSSIKKPTFVPPPEDDEDDEIEIEIAQPIVSKNNQSNDDDLKSDLVAKTTQLPDIEKKVVEPAAHKEIPLEKSDIVMRKRESLSARTDITYMDSRLPKKHPARFVSRKDVDVSVYSDKPHTSSYNLYDDNLYDWITNFSKINQKNGGCSLPASYILEKIIGLLYYDLNILPRGFTSREQFLKEIKNKMHLD